MFGTIIIMTDAAKGKARRFPGIKHRFAVNTRGFNVIRQSCVYFTIITISDDRFGLCRCFERTRMMHNQGSEIFGHTD